MGANGKRLLLAAGVLTVAAGGFGIWRWSAWPARVTARLPAEPDVKARLPLLAGRLAKARAKLTQRAELPAAIAELGRLYHANGFPAEAAACWETLGSIDAKEARWPHLLADAQRALGDYAGCEAALREAVARAPDDAPAWLQLAGLNFKAGKIADAEQAYARRLELLPGDSYARLGLARVALSEKRTDEARRSLEQLVRDAPDFPTAHNLLSELLAAAGDTERATLQRWLGREKGRFREAPDPWCDELVAWCFNAEKLRVLGTIDFQTNHGDRGRALFERAIALAPEDPAGHEILGELLLIVGELEPARAAFGEARRCYDAAGRKPSAGFFVHLAEAERRLGRAAAALELLDQATKQLGENAELESACGDALAELGRGDAALAAYQRAVSRDPSRAETHEKIAVALLDRGRRDEARSHLLAALEHQPTLASSLRLLGRIELDAGKLDEAGRYFRTLYESNPGVPLAKQLLAEWHQRVGALAENRKDAANAIAHYQQAAALNPENAMVRSGLGVLLLLNGRVAEAVAPLEELRRLQPQNPQPLLFLGQAYARLGRIEEAKRALSEGARLADAAGNAATAGFCREILGQL